MSVDPFLALGELPAEVNVGRHLPERARERPDARALIVPEGRSGGRPRWRALSFAELETRSSAMARGLAGLGLERGDRVSVFVRPGAEWVALVWALMRIGAVPVLIDPGMGRAGVLSCVRRIRPRAFIGIPLAQVLRRLYPAAFESVEIAVTSGPPRPWRGPTLGELARSPGEPLDCAPTRAADEAAILFTSGSTGPAKGAVYTHGMFDAQVRALKALYGLEPGGVDLACFPLFALFDAALGLTTVLPDMDPSKPARCNPARIVEAVAEHRPTLSFGSPAIWRRVIPHCRERGLRLEGLRQLMIAGAPVPPALIEDCLEVLGEGCDVHTPYGATESLPVSSASGREILARFAGRTLRGEGSCVGRVAPGIDLRLIRIGDEPIERWSDELEVAPGEPGEVCVRGPVVTQEYAEQPRATARAKIPAASGPAWHRMGDVGRLDGDGHLWFLGRLSHRIETAEGRRMPVPAENAFNRHPDAARTALIGVGPAGFERPVLVVEPEPGRLPRGRAARAALAAEILRLGAGVPACEGIEEVLFRRAFPVDVRHNAKIRREDLKRWAERELGS